MAEDQSITQNNRNFNWSVSQKGIQQLGELCQLEVDEEVISATVTAAHLHSNINRHNSISMFMTREKQQCKYLKYLQSRLQPGAFHFAHVTVALPRKKTSLQEREHRCSEHRVYLVHGEML